MTIVELRKSNPEGWNQYTAGAHAGHDEAEHESHLADRSPGLARHLVAMHGVHRPMSRSGQHTTHVMEHQKMAQAAPAPRRTYNLDAMARTMPKTDANRHAHSDYGGQRFHSHDEGQRSHSHEPGGVTQFFGKAAAFTDDFRGEHETIAAGKVTVRRKPGDVVVSLSKDSTGADAQFHQADDGKWTYRMQRPDHNGDYGDSEIYDHHGPFPSFGKALAHMDSTYANPGGYGINAKFHREFAAETKAHYARTAKDPYNFKPAAGHNGSSPHDCKGPSCVAAVAKLNVAADKLDKEANSREDEARDDRGRWTKSIDIEVEKGDTPGHEFHGNQWTVGDGSDHEIKHVAAYDKGKVGPGMIGDHLLDVKSEGGHGLQTASGHNPTDRQKHEELHFGKVERVSQRPRGNTWREFHPKKSADVVVELAKYSPDQERDDMGRFAAGSAQDTYHTTGHGSNPGHTIEHDTYDAKGQFRQVPFGEATPGSRATHMTMEHNRRYAAVHDITDKEHAQAHAEELNAHLAAHASRDTLEAHLALSHGSITTIRGETRPYRSLVATHERAAHK